MASILELAKQHQDSCGRGLRADRQRSFGSQSTSLNTWPMKSKVLGCSPAEIPRIKKHLASRGVKAEFTKRGECLVTSERHKKQIAVARGLFDYNGGYDSAGPTQMHKDLRRTHVETIVNNRMRFQRRVMRSLLARTARR